MNTKVSIAYILVTIFGLSQEQANTLSSRVTGTKIDPKKLERIAGFIVPIIYVDWLYGLYSGDEFHAIASELSSAFSPANNCAGSS